MGTGRKKTRVEQCWSLSTRDLRAVLNQPQGPVSGWMEWKNAQDEVRCSIGYEFDRHPVVPTLTVFYSAIRREPEERQDLRYPIELVMAPCRFGGIRYWFICPASKNGLACRRRTVKLYLPPQTIYWACRRCYELTYRSCQEHDGRVDRLCKNPDLLSQLLHSKKFSPTAFKAAFKLLETGKGIA